MKICEHYYVFQHTVYWDDSYNISGSSAKERIYGDMFYCRKCLHQQVTNQRKFGNNYQKPVANALPR